MASCKGRKGCRAEKKGKEKKDPEKDKLKKAANAAAASAPYWCQQLINNGAKIASQEWDIGFADMHNIQGETDPSNGFICLNSNTSGLCLENTLLHEVLHAVLAMTQCSYDLLGAMQEEQLVSRITPVLLSFLKDNKLDFGK